MEDFTMSKKTAGDKRTYVTIENFLRAYENPAFGSIGEVADHLGLKPSAVSQRASKLRQKGGDLRKFSGSGRPNVVEKANEILKLIRSKK